MIITLSNGKEYKLGFKHYYHTDAKVYGDQFWGKIKTIKEPVVTECYLREIIDGIVSNTIVARGIACKNPTDNPNKEIARGFALKRMVSLLSDTDAQIIIEAYHNR